MAGGWVIVTIRDALGIPQTVLPIGPVITLIVGPLLIIFVYDPIRRRLAMNAYISWLKSFEDEPVPRQRRRIRILRFVSMHFRRLLPRWAQRAPRGVTQVSLSLLPLHRHDPAESSTTEFPGEIFLV